MNLGSRICKPQLLSFTLKITQSQGIQAADIKFPLPVSGASSTITTSKLVHSNLKEKNLEYSHLLLDRSLVDNGHKFHNASDINIPRIPSSIIKEIIDPNFGNEKKIEIPLSNVFNRNFELPCRIDQVEKVDPVNKVVEIKTKTHMTIIRRKKMRKHKWRKLQKRMKFVFRKIRRERELKKEMLFQTGLKTILNEVEQFSAEKYLQDKLDTLHWVPPVTKARGMLAPQWVIKEILDKIKTKELYDKRIAECIKKTSDPK